MACLTSSTCRKAGLVCVLIQLLLLLTYVSFSSYTSNTIFLSVRPDQRSDQEAANTIVRSNGTSIRIEEKHVQDVEIKFQDSAGEKKDNATSVAIGVAVTTRTRRGRLTDIRKHIFFSVLMPSFCVTASTGYFYNFYIAFDFNDPLLSKADQVEQFRKTFSKIKNGACRQLTSMGLNFVKCSHTHKPAWAQNDAMMSAYMDHNDYFYRINDDTSMTTKGWTEIFIETLSGYDPPNIGVVGPAHSGGNIVILTYDFVHRTHVDIFGFYYPRYFPDWYGDRWITEVYKPDRSTKVRQVKLKHTMSKGTRYARHKMPTAEVNEVIDLDKKILKRYIDSKRSNVTSNQGKVIAMSLLGNSQAEVYGAIRNVLLQSVHLPKWNVRIYLERPPSGANAYRFSPIPQNVVYKLSQLPVKLVHVDTQTVQIDPSLWPALAVDDPSVDYLLVRKASSRLSDRDAAVVNEWLDSEKVIHVIKDHPKHSASKITPGLWGVNTKKLKGVLKDDFANLFSDSPNEASFLNDVLWPLVMNDAFSHDSLSCSNETRPFPVRRVNYEYLGQKFGPFGELLDGKFDVKANCTTTQ